MNNKHTASDVRQIIGYALTNKREAEHDGARAVVADVERLIAGSLALLQRGRVEAAYTMATDANELGAEANARRAAAEEGRGLTLADVVPASSWARFCSNG